MIQLIYQKVADAFLDNIVKIYDGKNIIFMQYGTEWLIYKFNIKKGILKNL